VGVEEGRGEVDISVKQIVSNQAVRIKTRIFSLETQFRTCAYILGSACASWTMIQMVCEYSVKCQPRRDT